ncbi:MAG: hypothetical protein ABL961_00125 [Vicinamibacterales bacterium]
MTVLPRHDPRHHTTGARRLNRRRRLLFACLCITLSLPLVGVAQMPDPKQMSGIPRPVTDLPNGSVSVRLIRGALTNNIADHQVELHVDGKVQTVKTDANGRAQFDGLPAGASLKAVAVVDGERLESEEFPAPGQGAIRLMLVATDTTTAGRAAAAAAAEPAVPGAVVLAGSSRIVIEPGEETLSVFYILDIVNNASGPVMPPVPFQFDMPAAMLNVGVLPGSSPLASNKGHHVTVSGPFPPGRTSVEVGGSLPVTSGSLSLTQSFPADFEQPVFIAKKERALAVSSPQFVRQQETDVQGTPVIIGAANPIAAGTPITLNISGLLYQSSTPRFVALGLALAIAVAGMLASLRRVDVSAQSAAAQKLAGRREKLMQELTRLEQDHRRGTVEESRFAARREELMSALERVYAALTAS